MTIKQCALAVLAGCVVGGICGMAFAQEEAAVEAEPVEEAAPAEEAAPEVKPAEEVAPEAEPAEEAAPEAQPVEEDPKKVLAQNFEEFRHFIKIAREDAARSFGQAVLESPVEDREVYLASEQVADVQTVLAQGERLSAELKGIIAKIQDRMTKGYEASRADPKEIAQQIEKLGGTLRAFDLASKRLAEHSREYALPQLIQKLTDPLAPESLKERIVTLLPKLGKDAVRGLSVALQTDDPRLREILAGALGDLGYRHSVPRLKELYDRKDILARARTFARSALIACSGQGAAVLQKPVAELYYELAEDYYNRDESLRPDARYETANVWYWRKDLGLTYKPVPRAIFCDVYAMRYARLALEHDPTFYPAVSLWMAANLYKEANLPEGAADPTRGEDQPGARYYALAGSAGFLQAALARALNDRNSAVAIGAIEALARTAGAKSLVKPVAGGAQPLVRALSYPDRHVRFLAAVSLANALPQQSFAGKEQVLWVLNEALRQTGQKTALLVVREQERRNLLKDAVRAAGYETLEASDPLKALETARASGIVDVVVLSDLPPAAGVVNLMRQDPLLVGMPAVCASDSEVLAGLAEKDGRIVVTPADVKANAVAKALARAAELGAVKPLTQEQAVEWAIRAAKAIRKLGETANPVYDISRSLPALAGRLSDSPDEVRIACAEALAVIKAAKAQQAIAALANDAAAAERVRIAAYGSLSESLRRFGNDLTDDLAQGVVDVVKSKGSQPLREAAAQALGAMNLPSQKISSLLVETAGGD